MMRITVQNPLSIETMGLLGDQRQVDRACDFIGGADRPVEGAAGGQVGGGGTQVAVDPADTGGDHPISPRSADTFSATHRPAKSGGGPNHPAI